MEWARAPVPSWGCHFLHQHPPVHMGISARGWLCAGTSSSWLGSPSHTSVKPGSWPPRCGSKDTITAQSSDNGRQTPPARQIQLVCCLLVTPRERPHFSATRHSSKHHRSLPGLHRPELYVLQWQNVQQSHLSPEKVWDRTSTGTLHPPSQEGPGHGEPTGDQWKVPQPHRSGQERPH